MKLKPFLMQATNIEVRPSAVHGYGVFASKNIAAGEIIEECPVVILQDATPFKHYCFSWREGKQLQSVLVLGLGMVYNHAPEPNADFEPDYEYRVMRFRAIKPIRCGEEIFTCYSKHWFEYHGIKMIRVDEQVKPKFSSQTWIRIFACVAALLFLNWFAKGISIPITG